MTLEVGTEAILIKSNSAWSGALVKIISIDTYDDAFGKMTVYSFEVMDKSLPRSDDADGDPAFYYVGATPFQSDFLEV